MDFDKVLFRAPRYSQHPLTHSNKLTLALGSLPVVMCRECSPSERISLASNQLTRFAPMLAPVMDQFRLDIDNVFVPARILKGNEKYSIDFEDFHNPSTNPDLRPTYPTENIFKMYVAACKASQNGDGLGTLYDYFNLPTFEAFQERLRNYPFLNASIFYENGSPSSFLQVNTGIFKLELLPGGMDTSEFSYPFWIQNVGSLLQFFGYVLDLVYDPNLEEIVGLRQGDSPQMLSYFGFVYSKFIGEDPDPLGNSTYDWIDYNVIEDIDEDTNFSLVRFVGLVASDQDQIYKEIGLTPTQLQGQFVTYLMKTIVRYVSLVAGVAPGAPKPVPINVAPFLAYWRCVYDWYINTNIDGDPDTLYAAVDLTKPEYMKPFNRRYPNDIFTSAFSSPQSGTAVPIPEGGTISDLRSANQLQILKEKIIYSGKRYVDNILTIFGQKSSNRRSDRSIVLKRVNNYVQIEAVTQTNQADISQMLDTPIGSLVGQGVAYSKNGTMFDFTVEEHGFYLCLVSIRPKASYFQGIPRYFLKRDFEEFLIPNFDRIGEQDIRSCQLFFDPVMGAYSLDANDVPSNVFGYNRRYYEYLSALDEVHGSFRSSLDFWTAGRKFSSLPTLSSEFIQVDPEESNLNRIFTVTDSLEQTIYMYINFVGSVVTPLNKYVEYDL